MGVSTAVEHRNVYLLMCRRPCTCTAVINVDQGVVYPFDYPVIQLSGQPLEPKCPDNRGSTVIFMFMKLTYGILSFTTDLSSTSIHSKLYS